MLNDSQRLLLQQLRILEWLDNSVQSAVVEPDGGASAEVTDVEGWAFARQITPLPWQVAAADAWEANGQKGTLKVVTGAGKTVAALVIADRVRAVDPDLRVAIVVPTIPLMRQWYTELTTTSEIPPEVVARMGGGFKEDFRDQRRILIAVLASARRDLPKVVTKAGIGSHLMLIVDESHRAGADESLTVLDTPRAYSLGLSATPERTDDGSDDDGSDRLWEQLGSIVYEMNFADAIRDGILPPFEVQHFGLSLTGKERVQYDKLTRAINDGRSELLATSAAARRAGGGGGLMRWAVRAAAGSTSISSLAAQFVGDTTKRKRLLYAADNRERAVRKLIDEAFALRADARIILFHESIGEATNLFLAMQAAGLPVVLEHSDLPAQVREATIELFREGVAQIVVSVKSLIEGFNVPEADLGIIVASSTSMRQRIQSIGRVLRRFVDDQGVERSSRICVLYVRDTVDEFIYEKADWDELLGLDRNVYYSWDLPADPELADGPPRTAIPDEGAIDVSKLAVGDPYPGRFAGDEFSCDRNDNVLDAAKSIARNPQTVPALIRSVLGRNGRFRVTPKQRHVLIRMPLEDDTANAGESEERSEWVTRYCGSLSEPFQFGLPDEAPQIALIDAQSLMAGDPYLGPLEPAQEIIVRQRRGGVIAKKIARGEILATGKAADELLGAIRQLHAGGADLHKLFVNEADHVFWREAGVARFVVALSGPLEFPSQIGSSFD